MKIRQKTTFCKVNEKLTHFDDFLRSFVMFSAVNNYGFEHGVY